MRRSRPPAHVPRLAEWLAARAVRHLSWRETALGDLREEADRLAATRGARRARIWYRRQAARLCAEVAADRVRAGRDALRPFIRPSGDSLMRSLLHETAVAVRSLRRQPLVTAVVIGTLALGLGANAATYGLIDRLMLRPFTIPNVDRLVLITERGVSDTFNQAQESVSAGTFLDVRARTTTLDRLAAFEWWDVNLSGGDRPERVQGHLVTSDFLPLLGAVATAGRLLSDEDAQPGRDRVAVISEGLWRRRFGAAPDVIGRAIRLDGEPYQVVGVLGGGFDFPYGTDIWAPLTFDADRARNHGSRYLTVAGALPPGASLESASAELSTAYEDIRRAHPEDIGSRSLVLRSFTEGMIDLGLPQALAVWQAAALLVLLIGCVNIANLLLARGAERQRELAVRLAIGAGRARIVRQLLVENLVVAILAVPAALGVAWVGFRLIRSAMPATLVRFLPGWTEMGVDWRVALVTLAAAVGTAVLFGLLPALRSSRPGLAHTLREGGRSATAGRGRSRLRRGLVVGQIAIALPLLILSGLSAVGIQRFATGPQGYDPAGVIRLRTLLPETTYPDAGARRRFVDRLLEEAARVPGVELAATSSVVPATTTNQTRAIFVDGVPLDADTQPPSANFRAISPDYLKAMRIPLLEGRSFTQADRGDGLPVAIVSQAMARRHWPDASPLDARITFQRDSDEWLTIVGVAGDTIDDWFANRRSPTVFVPAAQSPTANVFLVARTSGDPARLADGLREAVSAVDPTQAAFDVATMRDAIHERTTGLRFLAGIMLAFGLLALVLAAFGIYGVMAHFVAQRRHDIGVRMALGATAGRVLRQTIAEGARLSGAGIVLGLAIGIALARVMENALFGVASLEPSLVAAVTTALALVAAAACLLPARHATRVDPMTALRSE